MILETNGFKYDTEQIRGVCPEHKGPIIDTPHVLADLEITDMARAFAVSGLWGVGWCPVGRHYLYWTLPDFFSRYGATESKPYGQDFKINLDKIEEPI